MRTTGVPRTCLYNQMFFRISSGSCLPADSTYSRQTVVGRRYRAQGLRANYVPLLPRSVNSPVVRAARQFHTRPVVHCRSLVSWPPVLCTHQYSECGLNSAIFFLKRNVVYIVHSYEESHCNYLQWEKIGHWETTVISSWMLGFLVISNHLSWHFTYFICIYTYCTYEHCKHKPSRQSVAPNKPWQQSQRRPKATQSVPTAIQRWNSTFFRHVQDAQWHVFIPQCA